MFNLVSENAAILREPAPMVEFGVDSVNLQEISQHMMKLMVEQKGLGLSSQQVGFKLRMFVMIMSGKETVCVNPDITEKSGQIICEEGCLSFPELHLKIKRSETIDVLYHTTEGQKIECTLEGIESRCFQHELDHLNGITFDQNVSKLALDIAKRKRNKLMKRGK